ncbi:hypothetical protein Anapl_01171 [Anas platyrhynchos]|uniref:Secreted protein n=1 Tax=Anas platyrhynchos TaxID=8839 RepID=R0K6T5_ANAPL|nr:hypothetical protein Anapl_01171 [Anas platyrhynchos]
MKLRIDPALILWFLCFGPGAPEHYLTLDLDFAASAFKEFEEEGVGVGFSPGEPLLRAECYPWTVLLVYLSCTVRVLCVSEARSERMMAAKPCIDSRLAPT